MEIIKSIIEYGLYGILIKHFEVTGTEALLWLIPAILPALAGGYLLGSICSAVIISKKLFKDDVRNHGSKNAGMTNMFRSFGKKAGLLTLAGDAVKTALSVVLGYLCLGYIGAYLAGLFCMLGHMFPAYYKLKGGKGVVVAAFTILLTEPLVFLVLIVIFAVVLLGTRMVSLASGMTALLYPLMLNGLYAVLYGDGSAVGMRMPIAVLMTVMILIMHAENFKRIYNGKESKIKLPWNKESAAVSEAKIEYLSDADESDDEEKADKKSIRRTGGSSNYGKKKK